MSSQSVPSIEQEVKRYLHRAGIPFRDNTTSFTELDFNLLKDEQVVFALEVKEKRQVYRTDLWPAFAPEPELCILDDLTVRKCLACAPASGILVRDGAHPQPGAAGAGQVRYVFFSVIDLALMPKVRVNRPIRNRTDDVKGKWLVDFRNGHAAADLPAAFDLIRAYYQELPAILHDIHACYGDYVGEEIHQAGSRRRPGHWTTDVEATR